MQNSFLRDIISIRHKVAAVLETEYEKGGGGGGGRRRQKLNYLLLLHLSYSSFKKLASFFFLSGTN